MADKEHWTIRLEETTKIEPVKAEVEELLLLLAPMVRPERDPKEWLKGVFVSDRSTLGDFLLKWHQTNRISNRLGFVVASDMYLHEIGTRMSQRPEVSSEYLAGYEAAKRQAIALDPWAEHLERNPIAAVLESPGQCVGVHNKLIEAMQPQGVAIKQGGFICARLKSLSDGCMARCDRDHNHNGKHLDSVIAISWEDEIK